MTRFCVMGGIAQSQIKHCLVSCSLTANSSSAFRAERCNSIRLTQQKWQRLNGTDHWHRALLVSMHRDAGMSLSGDTISCSGSDLHGRIEDPPSQRLDRRAKEYVELRVSTLRPVRRHSCEAGVRGCRVAPNNVGSLIDAATVTDINSNVGRRSAMRDHFVPD